MTELEKIAFRHLRSELYDCRTRINELSQKIDEKDREEQSKSANAGVWGWIISPMVFIKSSIDKALKTIKAFDID